MESIFNDLMKKNFIYFIWGAVKTIPVSINKSEKKITTFVIKNFTLNMQ